MVQETNNSSFKTTTLTFLLEETKGKYEEFVKVGADLFPPYEVKDALKIIKKLREQIEEIFQKSDGDLNSRVENAKKVFVEIQVNEKIISDWAEKEAREWERGEILTRGNCLLKTFSDPEDKFPNGVDRHLIVFNKRRFFLVKTGGIGSKPFTTESSDQFSKKELIRIINYLLTKK